MSQLLIYHTLVTEFLNCRRAIVTKEMSDEEFEPTFNALIAALNAQYGQDAVDSAYLTFEADLQLMQRLEWLCAGGLGGYVIAGAVVFWSNEVKVNRACRIWESLVDLDEELHEITSASEGA